MSRAAPPKKKARPGWRSDRANGQHNKRENSASIADRPAPIKRLLAQRGSVWLFEVREGRDVRYQIEKNDLVLRFGLKFQAEGRFLRLAKKEPQP